MMFLSRCLRLILRDILTQSCLHQFLLEFVGTALFLSASLTAVLIRADLRSIAGLTNQSHPSEGPPHSGLVAVSPACPLQVVLVFGLSVAMAALSMGGAVHLNPAVSIAMVLTLRLTLWRAVMYMIGQLLGGVVSSALLLGLMGDVTPAVNQVSSGVRLHEAFIVEMLITLQLVLVVMVTAEVPLPVVATPLLVGLTVSLGHLVAVSPIHLAVGLLQGQRQPTNLSVSSQVGATGCGMNPARSFGPAAVTLDFRNHWVFWAGPMVGACVAALLNDLLLRPRWRHPGDWWAELKQLYVLTDKQQQGVLSQLP
ncbi:aquaporin-1-like isoform X1 [Girardinichthys multiradiatus]|uniref:aquaporin-1-like isoform X1 n=1 Tax=Girardinichthys multiradiatus TaxID=208333 RepID=UPI001FAD3A89|nr:aquaporin-1-like isoform X1 [Girardinichthys multiradiatus]XP_047215742.1 aquaporin-1-like isoform X1 [Girardinichthys multiradiatus]